MANRILIYYLVSRIGHKSTMNTILVRFVASIVTQVFPSIIVQTVFHFWNFVDIIFQEI